MSYPGTGQSPWGTQLKQYIDDGDARSQAAQVAAEAAAADAEAARDEAVPAAATASSAASTASSAATSAAASADTAAQAAEDAVAIVIADEDGAMATAISTPGSDTATALSASLGAQQADDASPLAVATDARAVEVVTETRRGNTMVIFGDSNTVGSFGPGPFTGGNVPDAKGWWNWANVALGHRFTLLSNAGKSGDWTQGMLDRLDTHVLAHNPATVTVMGGTNDLQADFPEATWGDQTAAQITPRLQEIYERLFQGGVATVVAMTVLPRVGETTARRTEKHKVNQWIRNYCATHRGMVLVEAGATVLDPTSATAEPLANTMLTGGAETGVHISAHGAKLIGEEVARVLAPLFPKAPDLLGQGNGEPGNLLTNSAFTGGGTGGSSAPTFPTSWLRGGYSPALGAVDKAASDDGYPGQWWQVDVADAGAGGNPLFIQQNVTTASGLTVAGDVLRASVEFQVLNAEAAPAANTQGPVALTLRSHNGSTFTVIKSELAWNNTMVNAKPLTSGVLVTPELIVPSGFSYVQFSIQTQGGGRFRFRRPAIRKVA